MTLPRVTDILADCGLGPDLSRVPAAVLEAARQRGTLVHQAIEGDHYGYDVEITPEAAPFLDSYRKFVAESGHEPIASELRVVHPSWGYQGHVDRVGFLLGRRVLLDWKTGDTVDLEAAGRQLAGYRLAWGAMHPEAPVQSVAVVQFRADGSYRFCEEIVNDPGHEQVFLAAVLVHQARARRCRSGGTT